MLIRLLPDQAGKYWEDIKVAIEESLPPTVGQQSDRMSNILQALLTDEVTAWISLEDRDDKNLITGIVLTTFTFDKISGTKALLLYCVYGYGEYNRKSWYEGAQTLAKFAKSEKCHRIVGYTDVPSMIEFVKKIGGETRYTFVSLPMEVL